MIDFAASTVRLSRQETLACEELARERVASWIRLSIATVGAVAIIFEALRSPSSISMALIRLGAMAAVMLYSSYLLFGYAKTGLRRIWLFLLTLCDATVVSYLLWSYSIGGRGEAHAFTVSTIFGWYGIVLMFTTIHHDQWLCFFAGVVSAVECSVVQILSFDSSQGPGLYLLRIGILIAASVLCVFVSGANRRSFNHAISFQMRYADLIDRIPEMLFSLDKSGRFIWCNAASTNLFGVKPDALIHRHISEFVDNPPTLESEQNIVKATLEARDIQNNRKFVDYTLRRVRGEDGTETFEGVMADTTDREIAIAQREEMANRLFQYQKMESLGTLASGMAHDFNNIMQSISDIAELVRTGTKESETRAKMELISQTLSDASFLISELLALGKRQPLDYSTVNLCAFFENVIPFFRKQLGEKYRIVLKMSDEPLLIQGDADYLKRVFQNLVDNARDAMSEGGCITIECFAVREKGKPQTVIIRISDTGSGIPSEIIDCIFDPFFTTKKPGKGTGLGLALVRRIVTLHNGRVYVERSSSAGTTFRIEIPEATKEDLDADTKQILLQRLSTTILLLDDDVKIREILKIFIRSLGYPVCEASTRSEAVGELMRHRRDCDVVIMDWKLGNEDPHRVVADLRAINPDLVVMVVSGYPPQPSSIEALKICKWFTKPYDKNMLDLEIQRALYHIRRKCSQT